MIYDKSASYFRMFKGADWSPDDSGGNAFKYNGEALTSVMDISNNAWAGLHAGEATFHCDIDNFKIKNGEKEVAVLSEIIKSLNRLFTLIGGTDDGTDHWLTNAIRYDTAEDDDNALADELGLDDINSATDNGGGWSP